MSEETAVVRVDIEHLAKLITEVFCAIGCPPVEAAVIAEELVLADRMGVHSHGSARVGEYLEEVKEGIIVPGGSCSLAASHEGTAIVDGGRNFGQVVARFAFEVGAERARAHGISCTVSRNCHHVGRFGALSERAAEANLICLATIAAGFPGVVAPWGGAEGVLGTNPFSYGVPLENGAVIADFATSTMSEGATRMAFRQGKTLAEGTIIAPDGRPSTDPSDFFGDPPGALLPFGGSAGYKGYALNVLPEFVGATLAGYGPDPSRPCNILFLVLIDPAAFLPVETFKSLATKEAELIHSARALPGSEVLLPGEREACHLAANSTTVTIPRAIYDDLASLSNQLGTVTRLD